MNRPTAGPTLGWLARWGFGILVVAAACAAVWAGLSTPPPVEIPDFALRASAIYRLEVGAVVFAALYLASTALVLALNNRAFTELGTGGISARDIGREEESATLRGLEANTELLRQIVADKTSQKPYDERHG
jgi:hypothetical protein